MYTNFNIIGKVEVRDNLTTRKLVDELNRLCGEIRFKIDTNPDETFVLHIWGGQHCPHDTACNIKECLKKFGPHVVGEVGEFRATTDGAYEDIQVGDDRAIRDDLVKKAREAVLKLTRDEFFSLMLDEMSNLRSS